MGSIGCEPVRWVGMGFLRVWRSGLGGGRLLKSGALSRPGFGNAMIRMGTGILLLKGRCIVYIDDGGSRVN